MNKLNRKRLAVGPALKLMIGRSPRGCGGVYHPHLCALTPIDGLTVSMGEKSGHRITGFSAQGLRKLKPRCWQGLCSHLELRVHFTLLQVFGRIQLLVVIGLNPTFLLDTSTGCSRVHVAHSVGDLQHGCALYQAKRRICSCFLSLFSGLR